MLHTMGYDSPVGELLLAEKDGGWALDKGAKIFPGPLERGVGRTIGVHAFEAGGVMAKPLF